MVKVEIVKLQNISKTIEIYLNFQQASGKFDVVVDVHAEMGYNPTSLHQTTSKLTSNPTRKRSNEQSVNDIFAIKDNVEWKRIAGNVDQYRIKDKESQSSNSNDDLYVS